MTHSQLWLGLLKINCVFWVRTFSKSYERARQKNARSKKKKCNLTLAMSPTCQSNKGASSNFYLKKKIRPTNHWPSYLCKPTRKLLVAYSSLTSEPWLCYGSVSCVQLIKISNVTVKADISSVHTSFYHILPPSYTCWSSSGFSPFMLQGSIGLEQCNYELQCLCGKIHVEVHTKEI